jgi:hypothetical protein
MSNPIHTMGTDVWNSPGNNEAADFGYFAIDHRILMALKTRHYLDGGGTDGRWSDRGRDCGYYAINRSIARALKRLART